MRDNIADFDDFWRPLRSYFYWEKHCFGIPICWSLRSLFDVTDKFDQLTDQMDKNLKAALIQDAVTPQLVDLIGQNADQLDRMRQIILTEHSTIAPQLTQLDELSRQMMDLGYAFDSSEERRILLPAARCVQQSLLPDRFEILHVPGRQSRAIHGLPRW